MVCAPTCDPGTLLGSSFARDVTLRPVAGNTVLSAPLLQRQGFVVLNRSTPLHARTSASGEQGIRASTGHAPHLINLVDWQRMLAAGAFDAAPIFKAAAACGGVSFAPWCVGRGKGDRHRFIEAFQHYCRHQKVDSR